ncbi:probable cytochrome P450 49a1 isoform X2 [Papilio machaon]|uniref:probable cytochrome P450 49a1 isoform X2 n=1 Tax=Papilio machaon TaxID=76193 RepID=UPI001E6640A1|nr:probable cytochrome P450 49a1 isoform X2 [Papilio machaon]
MSTPAILIRQFVIPRQSRRRLSGSGQRGAATSPQRRSAPAPAQQPRPFTHIPGPLALPMLRHSAYVLPRIGNFHHSVGLGLLEGLRTRYGDLVRLAKASRKRPVLYVFDPDIMKEVYESKVTQPPQWQRSPLHEQRRHTANQHTSQGDETKEIWSAIGTLLQDGTLLNNYDKVFDDIAASLTRRLGELRHLENALNDEISTELYRWALETLGAMLFGIRLGCLDGPAHVPTDENRAKEKTSLDDDTPETCSLWNRCEDELTAAERLVRCSLLVAGAGHLVRSEHTLKRDSDTFNTTLQTFDMHYSLTEHFLLLAVHSLRAGSLRPEQVLLDRLRPLQERVLPLASDVLLAGVEPLAQTALSMFYQLSLHAAQQQRAHDEVSWGAAARAAGAPHHSCTQLPYLRACANEALRLFPVTGGVVRRSTQDMVLAGYEIPAGVDIVLAHGVTSKDEKQWGRGKSFIPERWCSEGWEPLRATRAHPTSFKPFGERCPASGVVSNMLAALATRVLDRYRLEWHGPAPTVAIAGVNKLQPPYYFVLQNAS